MSLAVNCYLPLRAVHHGGRLFHFREPGFELALLGVLVRHLNNAKLPVLVFVSKGGESTRTREFYKAGKKTVNAVVELPWLTAPSFGFLSLMYASSEDSPEDDEDDSAFFFFFLSFFFLSFFFLSCAQPMIC